MSATTSLLGLDQRQVFTAPIVVRTKAHDASHFLLYPQAVVVPRNADDVAHLLAGCAAAGLGVTFRSGGTSLSGQAGTDAVLADVRRHFDRIEVLDGGRRVRTEPGVTVNRLNAHLAPYGRMIGPDPASSAACTIGGVVANNSSGMACGTTNNAYHTLDSLVVVLASGTVVDTGQPDADALLQAREPDLVSGLLQLRRRITDNQSSVATIKRLFAMKNTMGYGLNAFIDFDTPSQILAHLMVGSEGTLGFVASATFRTIPVRPHVQTALLVFDNLHAANEALPALVATGAATLELMDTASIKVGQALADCPPQIAAIKPVNQAALLLEYQSASAEELALLVASANQTLAGLPVEQPVALTADAALRDKLWVLRKGLYTTVAAARQPGTTALLEDVVVPVADLADACTGLTELFDEYTYPNSVIFGHAKDGNIHFMITDRFDKELERYARFTEAMVSLVLGLGGSLKAEHGTGRVMAPFVAQQYGDELYDVMREVKHLFDPRQLLNDGVVITDDPLAHLKHIKVPVAVDPLVDACVECGYCEPVCPARSLTLTPRQRIVAGREIAMADATSDQGLRKDLERAYVYEGVQTCAADGMCLTACPVGIDTGLFTKQRRAELASGVVKSGWRLAAGHWSPATKAASAALSVVSAGRPLAPAIKVVNQAVRYIGGADNVPLWSPELPRGGRSRRHPITTGEPEAVYIPACVNSMFGPETAGGTAGVQQAFESLCELAGVTVVVPSNIDSLCCGTPWTSKGMRAGVERMAGLVAATVGRLSNDGQLPIICDASSCTQGLQRELKNQPNQRVIDCVQFVAERILPRLGPIDKVDSITLHPTCASTQMGLDPYVLQVAQAVAWRVDVPKDAGCCGFAGDRGLLHPELTRAATRPEAAEVAQIDASWHASCNRTCELGMARATGQPYHHILQILAHQVMAQQPVG